MNALRTNLRYTLRQLRRNPGYATVAVLTLALGIGATTLIFSVIDGVLLRPLPYGEPDRVAMVWNRWVDYDATWLSQPEVVDYREAESFEALAAFTPTAVNLTGGDGPERVDATVATPNLFAVLGVDAAIGRTFSPDEGRPGGDAVVVLGHGLWRRRFAGDRSVVGRTIRLDGSAATVVGVMPEGFRTPLDVKTGRRTELYTPLVLDPDNLASRGSHYLYAVGKLVPDRSAEVASEELGAITDRLTNEGRYSVPMRFSAYAVPVRAEIFGAIRPALLMLFGAVGFVLLIACANVANLLLARAESRQREFAVRAALGAGRRAVLRQLLTEGLVLAAAGAVAGIGLAYIGLEALIALNPGDLPRLAEIGIDGGGLGFTAAAAGLSGVLFSLAPAVHLLRADLQGALREGGRGASAGGRRMIFQRSLVAAQVVLAFVLLTGAGLMIQSFRKLLAVDPGFRAERVLTLRVATPAADYPAASDVVSFHDRLLDRVRALPGVEAAGATRFLPLSGTIGDWTVRVEGRQPAPGTDFDGDWQVVSPGYFEAMGIPLIEGRRFDERDHADGAQVIVINERMARDYWPGGSALGSRIRFGGDGAPWRTVVGVVGDVRHTDVTEELRRTWYAPHAQFAVSTGTPIRAMTLTIHTTGDPTALIAPARDAVRTLDPGLPVAQVRTLDDVVSAARARPRFLAALLLAFAALAVVLAVVGIYGVMAYVVRQRDHDIGIRIALGADRRNVLGEVMRGATVPIAAGIGLGLLGASALTRTLTDMLYEVEPTDPATLAAVTLLFAAVAALASYIPARRATRIDPIAVLREE